MRTCGRRVGAGTRQVASRTLVLAACLAAVAAGQDSIRFERHFPGAVPERFEVTLTEDGTAVYAEPGEEPEELEVGGEEAAAVFERARSLEYFAKPLASGRKVASTGRKVLRYESAGQLRGEAVFDYSEESLARETASWFVKLAETLQHRRALERAYRFDRLGVNHALVNLEQAFERNRIVAPRLLEAVLERIAAQPRIVHLARARSKGLLERIQTPSE